MDLKEALLTLRNTPSDGEDVYKELLTASAAVVRLAIRLNKMVKKDEPLSDILATPEGVALDSAFVKARAIVPWFGGQSDILQLAVDIMTVRLVK